MMFDGTDLPKNCFCKQGMPCVIPRLSAWMPSATCSGKREHSRQVRADVRPATLPVVQNNRRTELISVMAKRGVVKMGYLLGSVSVDAVCDLLQVGPIEHRVELGLVVMVVG